MNIPKIFLTEAIDSNSVLRILINKNKQIDDTHPKYKYYSELAKWADPRQQERIKDVDLSTIKLSDKGLIGKQLTNRYNTLGSLLDRLKNLMDQEGKYNPESEKAKLIQQTMVDVLASLSGKADPQPEVQETPEVEREPEQPAAATEGNAELYQGMDWTAEKAKRLADAQGTGNSVSDVLDKFYDDYYHIEYASGAADETKIVAKLKSLDKLLIQEFNKLGYSPEVNPFAAFLKILIKEKPDIFEKLTLNTYGAIHNSFINKYITGNMLGKKFDTTNILFCSDLYNNNGQDIVEYLSLQKQVNDAKKNSEYVDDDNLIAKIFIQQTIPLEQSEQPNYSSQADKLLSLSDPIQPGKGAAKLRSMLEIQELYRHLFNAEAEHTKKKVDLKTVVDIVNKAEEQNIILDMIKLILAQTDYAGSSKYAEEAQKIDSWLDGHNHTSTKENIKNSRAILINYKLDAPALSLIIRNLKDRIDDQTEKKS